MNLFYSMIYSTFSSKYGVKVKSNETHTYGFNLHRYHLINHIQTQPKQFPLEYIVDGTTYNLLPEDLEKRELVFIQFGDTINCLTGTENEVVKENVNFNYSELCIIDKESGLTFKGQPTIWVKNEFLEFELVMEDYNPEEHKYFKEIFAKP